MSSKYVRIMAAVSEHWLRGSLLLTDTRIQEALNDGTSDFVHLMDVQICPNAERGSSLTTLSKVVVPKSKIEMVILPTNQHEAPEKRWNNLTSRTSADVFAIVGNYHIRGELPLSSKSDDSLYTLTHQLGRFFPITRVTMSGPGAKQLSVPVLLTNKDFVNCFYVGEPGCVDSASVKLQSSPQAEASDCEEAYLVKLVEEVNALVGEAD